VILSTW